MKAGTPRRATGATFPQWHPPLSPCPQLWSRMGWGRGRRHPSVALPGSATPLLWQRFPSELVAARAPLGLPRSLASSSPLSLPPMWAGGGSTRGPGRGPGRRPPARAQSCPRERLSPGTTFHPHSKPAQPATAAVLTGPGILLELVLLPWGEWPSPADGLPGLWEATAAVAAAAPGSRQWPRKRLGALGWRRGARARPRTQRVPAQRARARQPAEGPHPQPQVAEEAAPRGNGERGTWDAAPTCRAQTRYTRAPSSQPQGIPPKECTGHTPPGDRLLGRGHASTPKHTLVAHAGYSAKQLRSRTPIST